MLIHIPIFHKSATSIDAITIGPVVLCWVKDPSETLLRHEKIHTRQFLADPFRFHFRYFYEMLSNKWNGMTWREAYRAISFEVEAREKSELR